MSAAVRAPLRAVRDALGNYLQTALGGGVKVWDAWPTPGRALPAQAVSVITAGTPTFDLHEPVVWATTATSSIAGTCLYSYGRAAVPLQIDAWATYEEVRDTLALTLEGLLNRSVEDTLSISVLQHLGTHPGLVLSVPELYDTLCEYSFGGIASPVESSQQAQTQEWRATWTGNAFFYLVSLDNVPLMSSVTIRVGDTNYIAQ